MAEAPVSETKAWIVKAWRDLTDLRRPRQVMTPEAPGRSTYRSGMECRMPKRPRGW